MNATSWNRPEMKSLMRLPGVFEVVGDQCMYGLRTKSSSGKERAAKKRTRFLTNMPEAQEELSRKCDGRHEHQHLVEGRARAAEVYPEELCRAICRAVVKLKERQSRNLEMVFDVSAEHTEIQWLLKLDKHADDSGAEWWTAWDDVNQVKLDPDAVRKAREEEVKYIVDMGVF